MLFLHTELTRQYDDFTNYREAQVDMFILETPDQLIRIGSVKYSYCCFPYDRKSEVCTSQPYIFDLEIVERYRNQGAGKLLIKKCIEYIKSNVNIHYRNEIGVSTDPLNLPSNKIFESLDFKEISTVRSLKLDLIGNDSASTPGTGNSDNSDLEF